MKRIRSGRGLGDNLYLHSIVGHLVSRGVQLEVCTSYPTIFPFDVKFAEWSRNAHIVCHYVNGKSNPATHQFQDCAILAGVPDAEYRAYWPTRQSPWVDKVRRRAQGKKILLVNGGRWPMDRADGYGRELLPDANVFNAVLQRLRDEFFIVFIGRGDRLFDVVCDLDLNNRTRPHDVMDLALAADAGVGQVGYMIPLMEIFDKPLLVMFTGSGFRSRERWIAQLTPQKLFGKKTSAHVVDEWSPERIDLELDAFCHPGVGRGTIPRQVGSNSR